MSEINYRPDILLSVDQISMSFGGVKALEDINFDGMQFRKDIGYQIRNI